MKEAFKTSIGGQALIEGVMMRGPETTAMAVRIPDGSIDVETWPTKSAKVWYKKTPFVRGIFNMVDSLRFGYTCLMKSMEKAGFEEEEPSKFERFLAEKLGKSLTAVVGVVALILGMGLAIGLFTVLPTLLVGFFGRWVGSGVLRSLLEGVVKIAVFVAYLALVSKVPDIHRVFMYHGAEHKSIACYEQQLPLTVENIREQSRFHPRCGTSFILIVLVVSILTFSVIRIDHIALRVIIKLAMLPLVVGIAYELIKYAGRLNNSFTRFLSAPGLWLQRLTTVEPDDSQIEVAIASLTPCIPKEKGADEW
jgi:uncharacterized protein YqhQ